MSISNSTNDYISSREFQILAAIISLQCNSFFLAFVLWDTGGAQSIALLMLYCTANEINCNITNVLGWLEIKTLHSE